MTKEIIPTVGVVAIKDNQVLMVHHQSESEHLADSSGLPAGRVEEDETNEQAAIREFQEETGLIAKSLVELPEKYIAELPRKNGESVLMSWVVYLCLNFTGELVGNAETHPEWIDLNEYQTLNLNPNVDNAIQQALTHL